MTQPSGAATINDINTYANYAWWTISGRPDEGGGVPVPVGDVATYAAEAVAEILETSHSVGLVEVPGGTSPDVSQYSTPSGVIAVWLALLGNDRPFVLRPVRAGTIDAFRHSTGRPRFFHFDRELGRIILFPTPEFGGEELKLVASLSFTGGAKLAVPVLGYATVRAIEKARLRHDIASSAADVAHSIAEVWRSVL